MACGWRPMNGAIRRDRTGAGSRLCPMPPLLHAADRKQPGARFSHRRLRFSRPWRLRQAGRPKGISGTRGLGQRPRGGAQGEATEASGIGRLVDGRPRDPAISDELWRRRYCRHQFCRLAGAGISGLPWTVGIAAATIVARRAARRRHRVHRRLLRDQAGRTPIPGGTGLQHAGDHAPCVRRSADGPPIQRRRLPC